MYLITVVSGNITFPFSASLISMESTLYCFAHLIPLSYFEISLFFYNEHLSVDLVVDGGKQLWNSVENIVSFTLSEMWTIVVETHFLRQEDVEDSTLSTVRSGTTERENFMEDIEKGQKQQENYFLQKYSFVSW